MATGLLPGLAHLYEGVSLTGPCIFSDGRHSSEFHSNDNKIQIRRNLLCIGSWQMFVYFSFAQVILLDQACHVSHFLFSSSLNSYMFLF